MNTKLNALPQTSVLETVANGAQDIVHMSADYRQARGHRKQVLAKRVTEALDGLLSFLMTRFDGEVSKSEVGAMFEKHEPITESRLAALPRAMVPLVVVRELISVHEVEFNRRDLQNWNLFSSRYMRAVI